MTGTDVMTTCPAESISVITVVIVVIVVIDSRLEKVACPNTSVEPLWAAVNWTGFAGGVFVDGVAGRRLEISEGPRGDPPWAV